VLGSANESNIPTDFEHGWLNLGFADASIAPIHTLTSTATLQISALGQTTAGSATFAGLPVVGFAVQSFANGAITVGNQTVLSNYGGNFVQKGTRSITLGVVDR
jgi:hypothetical protein